MGGGRKFYRTGLLIMKIKISVTLTVLLLIPFLLLNAQETDTEEIEDPGPDVFVSVNPEIPLTGKPVTVSLIIDYPVPEEVTVIAPLFANSLALDRIVKSPRVTGTQTLTVVEYRFTPVRSGRVVMESFTVVCPSGIRETDSFVLNIRSEGDEPVILTPRLVWEGAPRQMAAGDRVTLVLRASGWNSRSPHPEFFMPPVPHGVILALLPLSEQERAGGIAVKLDLIALDPGDFRLSASTIRHNTADASVVFSIPALNIQITGSSILRRTFSPEQIQQLFDESSENPPPFPEFSHALAKTGTQEIQRLRCEEIYNTAKELWDSGLYAKALAFLRRNERDQPAGDLLAPIRRQAEENLGFFNTEDESRQRRKLLSVVFSFILFVVIITPFVCLFLIKKRKSDFAITALRWKTMLLCAIVFSSAVSFLFYRLAYSNFVYPGKGNSSGVTKETPVRRMADIEGEGISNFREGQPVVILLNSGLWLFVRANDAEGFKGWIPAEELEFY